MNYLKLPLLSLLLAFCGQTVCVNKTEAASASELGRVKRYFETALRGEPLSYQTLLEYIVENDAVFVELAKSDENFRETAGEVVATMSPKDSKDKRQQKTRVRDFVVEFSTNRKVMVALLSMPPVALAMDYRKYARLLHEYPDVRMGLDRRNPIVKAGAELAEYIGQRGDLPKRGSDEASKNCMNAMEIFTKAREQRGE